MMAVRSLLKIVVLVSLILAVPALRAQNGLSDAFLRLHSSRDSTSRLLGPTVATADFNSDTHPDGAVLFRTSNTFHIEVHYQFGPTCSITFDSDVPALAISALDVNHDGTTDLVIEEPFSHRRLFIWLNDGNGFFRPAQAQEYPGSLADFSRRLTTSLSNPHGLALLAAAKLRIREASRGSYRLPPAPNAPRFVREEAFYSAEYFHQSNLLRGPPSISLL